MTNRDDRYYDERILKDMSAVKKYWMVFNENERRCTPKDWNGVFSQYGEFFPEHINCRYVISRSVVVHIFFDPWHRWVIEENELVFVGEGIKCCDASLCGCQWLD